MFRPSKSSASGSIVSSSSSPPPSAPNFRGGFLLRCVVLNSSIHLCPFDCACNFSIYENLIINSSEWNKKYRGHWGHRPASGFGDGRIGSTCSSRQQCTQQSDQGDISPCGEELLLRCPLLSWKNWEPHRYGDIPGCSLGTNQPHFICPM